MNFQRRRRSHDIGDLYRHNMSLNRVFIATDVRKHIITVRPLEFFFIVQTCAFDDLFEKSKINFLTVFTFSMFYLTTF